MSSERRTAYFSTALATVVTILVVGFSGLHKKVFFLLWFLFPYLVIFLIFRGVKDEEITTYKLNALLAAV